MSQFLNLENMFVEGEGEYNFPSILPTKEIPDVKNWIELHNNPKNGIIIGMFGRTYDKDYQEKVKFMESLRQSTNIPYNLESHTIGDKYFYVFNTDICEKEKKYIKKR